MLVIITVEFKGLTLGISLIFSVSELSHKLHKPHFNYFFINMVSCLFLENNLHHEDEHQGYINKL